MQKTPQQLFYSRLTAFLGILASLSAGLIAHSQKATPRAFELSAISVAKNDLPPIYYQTVDPETQEKEFRELQVGDFARGAYASIPTSAPSELYTGTFDDNNRPKMERFLDLPSGKKDDRWLLLFYQDPEGQLQYRLVDESGSKHPARSVRFINTSPSKVAVSIDGQNVLVPGETDQLIASELNPNERFAFTYAVKTSPNNVYRAPEKNLRIRFADHRMMMIYTSLPQKTLKESFGESAEPQYEISYLPTCFRLYDRLPKES